MLNAYIGCDNKIGCDRRVQAANCQVFDRHTLRFLLEGGVVRLASLLMCLNVRSAAQMRARLSLKQNTLGMVFCVFCRNRCAMLWITGLNMPANDDA